MKSKISIMVLVISFFVFPKDAIRVLSSNSRSILIEFSLSNLDAKERIINNQKFYDIYFDGYSNQPVSWGEPAVPEYILNVGVPDELGNTIEILNTMYTDIDGRITPLPKPQRDGKLDSYKYEVNKNYYQYKPSDELVTFGEFGTVRDVKVQTVRVLPVKFHPGTGKIRLYTKIIFRINFAPHQTYPNQVTDELAKGSIINYQIAKKWTNKSKRLQKINVVNSVLSSGIWYRFEAPEEGMYKITRDMLSSYGIDPTVDPRTIKIYNNGGKMLPENVLAPRPVDMVENAIWVIGEDDGKFDDNDYILFYGRGNDFWDCDTVSGSIKRYFNLYSNENYYWITSGGSPGKRIQDKPSLNTTPDYVQTSTYAFADWDVDKINIGQSGRIFIGDAFSQAITSRIYMNTLDFRKEGTPIVYKFRFVNASENSFLFKLYESSNQIFTQNFSGYGSSQYIAGLEYIRTVTYNATLPGNRSVLKFEITPSAVNSVGYLDYFEITYQKELKPANNSLLFFGIDSTGVVEYHLSNFPNTNIKIFDVTNYADVRYITNHILLSGGECRFQVSENQGHVSKYLGIGNDDYKTPSNPVQISNSNIHGITQGAKFIIITHEDFKEAAERLKTYRENEAQVKISTIVVDVHQIFNEFSCGMLDVSAIRDFLKYAYENWQVKPEYVLFFGSGNYDYKNIEGYNTNYVPTFQSYESLALLDSYTSDDFFAEIDDDNKIDFANGRIPCKTPEEANLIVDKIIRYETESQKGLWRNRITLVADDGYTSDRYEGAEHTRPSEALANSTIPKSFDINKIYMAAYPIELTGSGKRMPAVNRAIIDAINQGTLIMNYIGHGSPELWAHEVVFEKSITIPQLNNKNYFFLIAATCSFGYFDIPNFQSGAEAMLFLEDAGLIASLTSARLALSIRNHSFVQQFLSDLFTSERDTLNLIIPIGKVLFDTKQGYTQINDRRYFLFGDPTMRLKIPQYSGEIDSINGQTLNTNVQLKALSTVKVDGFVKNAKGNIWDDFNGEGLLSVYDSEGRDSLEQIAYNVVVPGGLIFRGRVSIINGRFSATFVVPKDISYENKNGKVQLYFLGDNEDGISFTNNVIVGGTDTTAVNDGSGPEIEIYFDDTSYQNSYLVNSGSELIVKLSDESGINTTGTGVGHRLEGILNDKESEPIDFTKYFTGDLDAGGKTGQINYTLEALDDGDYKLDVKAWDIFNNFSTETSYFTIVSDDGLVIRDVFNYPNPFASSTTFTFQQNMNSIIDVEVKIYTIAGRLIKSLKKDNVREKFVTVDWDGRDEDGNQIANGTYLYKLKVKTVDGQYTKSVLSKLAVIR